MIGAIIIFAFLGLDLAAVVFALARLSRLRGRADMTDVRYRNPRRLFRE
jgi:uncharacterized membrane protein